MNDLINFVFTTSSEPELVSGLELVAFLVVLYTFVGFIKIMLHIGDY